MESTTPLRPTTTVVSDGLTCLNAVTEMDCRHEIHIVGIGAESVEHPAFTGSIPCWVM